MRNQSGQAMMITITFIALLFIVGVAFFSLASTERVASIRHLDVLRTHYIAEAGVAYARSILNLDREANLIDTLTDMTLTNFIGNDLDMNGDGKQDARWIEIQDSFGQPFGRFGIKIADEASKLNVNTCSADQLERFFSVLGLSSSVDPLLARRPFNAVEQMGSILGKKDFALCRDFLTVYTRDDETDLTRIRKAYLSSFSSQKILQALLDAGVAQAHQVAANLKDASDEDAAQTRFDRFVRAGMVPTLLAESGSWAGQGKYYEAPAGSKTGRFSWSNLSLQDGEYLCYCFGREETDSVGTVALEEGSVGEFLFSGDSLTRKVKVSGGSFSLMITPAHDKTSRFSHVDLVSLSAADGMSRQVITGTEALVINELMPKPWQELLLSGSLGIEPGQIVTHTFTSVKPGNYYVVVLAGSEGGLVGSVTIHGSSGGPLYDKQFFPAVINCPGDLTVQIQNNGLTGGSFRGIQIRQQPDAEFMEILNLSGQEIDLGGFCVEVTTPEGEWVAGSPGMISEGVTIKPYQYLVLAVDFDDNRTSGHLKNNKISFQGIWHTTGVPLVFDEQAQMDKNSDFFPDTGAVVFLKDRSKRTVDAVEYSQEQVRDLVSLERADPSSKKDSDGDGFFDGWFQAASDEKATPGSLNENKGMYTRDPLGRLVQHTPAEIAVFNRPLTGWGEAGQLSDGREWGRVSIFGLSRMADKLSTQALSLNLSGHYLGGDSGIWEFSNIPKGNYLLTIVSAGRICEGDRIQVSTCTDGSPKFQGPVPLMFSAGVAVFGEIECGPEAMKLRIKIAHDFEKPLSIERFVLEPVAAVSGRINLNTANPTVLGAVLRDEVMQQLILQNRPLGIQGGLNLGTGQIFLLDPGFLPLADQFTVRSDVYEINCRGEYFPLNKTLAYQTIRAVVERGDQ